jgi:hypothetical protein
MRELLCNGPVGQIAFETMPAMQNATGENYMTMFYRILLIAALATLGTHASAQSQHGSRYEMVTIPHHQNNSMMTTIPQKQEDLADKVVILDKQTGELWSWSESATISYLGKIFPIAVAGPFARIIQIKPEKSGR